MIRGLRNEGASLNCLFHFQAVDAANGGLRRRRRPWTGAQIHRILRHQSFFSDTNSLLYVGGGFVASSQTVLCRCHPSNKSASSVEGSAAAKS